MTGKGIAEKKKLGEMLIEAGLIDNLQLDSALGHQRNWGGRLGSILIELGFVTETELAGFIERQLNYSCTDIRSLNVPKEAVDSIKGEVAKKYTVFPIKLEGGTITLTMTDPTDLRVIDELQFITGKRIKPDLALESEIKRAIRKYYEGEDTEGRLYRVEKKSVEIKEDPIMMETRPEERVLTKEGFVLEDKAMKEPQKVGPKIDIPKKGEKKELPPKVILEALASLLIEKGIIRKEELLERIKKQLRE